MATHSSLIKSISHTTKGREEVGGRIGLFFNANLETDSGIAKENIKFIGTKKYVKG